MGPGSWYVPSLHRVMEWNAECLIQWFIMVLYRITTMLFTYCITLFVLSPLVSFAITVDYQVIMFLVYVRATLPPSALFADNALPHKEYVISMPKA